MDCLSNQPLLLPTPTNLNYNRFYCKFLAIRIFLIWLQLKTVISDLGKSINCTHQLQHIKEEKLRQANPLIEEGSPELKTTRNRSKIKKNINFLLMLCHILCKTYILSNMYLISNLLHLLMYVLFSSRQINKTVILAFQKSYYLDLILIYFNIFVTFNTLHVFHILF